jgi:uridine kinase
MRALPIDDVDLHTTAGQRAYQRTVLVLLCVAARWALPHSRVSVEHSLSNGVYCEVHLDRPFSARDTALLESTMRQLVAEKLPIDVVEAPPSQAAQLLAGSTNTAAASLVSQLKQPSIALVKCGSFYEYCDGPVLMNSALVPHFRLRFYLPGLVLQTPEDETGRIPPYREQPKLASIYREAERWAHILGVGDAAALNKVIQQQGYGDLVRVSEALHEKKIAAIADMVAQNQEIRLITIAGPSSSGKTSLAQRLKIQLRVNGLRPVTISLDDYFLDRAQTPIGDDGKPDFEAIEALDLGLLGDHLSQLIQGGEVDVPVFDFHTGRRSPTTRKLAIAADQPIIIEGIHGLNDRLTASVPKGHKFEVYISALTQINIHEHVRIHTTDARLIRRLVRDAQFRSHPAEETIRMWPMVRRGEKRNIFPFQEEADVMFNSALVYELAVLRSKAEPLLAAIPPDSPTAAQASQLLWLLRHFDHMPAEDIPENSILREFIGGSCFAV